VVLTQCFGSFNSRVCFVQPSLKQAGYKTSAAQYYKLFGRICNKLECFPPTSLAGEA
jgi:hypothetical protein